MTTMLRLLVTGFGSFPGAPYNPTPDLVERLTRLRRPLLHDVTTICHVFPVTYQAVDRQFPVLLARYRPHALLMFGLAAQTRYLRIETRARNAVTGLWPDAAGDRLAGGGRIGPGPDVLPFGPHTGQLLRAAQSTGIDARLSRNAGSYLCNYLCWQALDAARRGAGPKLSAFIHVPLVARQQKPRPRPVTGPLNLRDLVAASEAVLLQIVALARHKVGQVEE